MHKKMKIGGFFIACNGHVSACTNADDDGYEGISLENGSMRSCAIRGCGVYPISAEEAMFNVALSKSFTAAKHILGALIRKQKYKYVVVNDEYMEYWPYVSKTKAIKRYESLRHQVAYYIRDGETIKENQINDKISMVTVNEFMGTLLDRIREPKS